MKLICAVPALPVRNISQSATFFRDKLGFTLVHNEDRYAVLRRDAVEIHLWAATDEGWRERTSLMPIISGAESFIAGTASCRVGVEGVDTLYQELQPLGILHPNAHLHDTDFGTREFAVSDIDNNLITFFEHV